MALQDATRPALSRAGWNFITRELKASSSRQIYCVESGVTGRWSLPANNAICSEPREVIKKVLSSNGSLNPSIDEIDYSGSLFHRPFFFLGLLFQFPLVRCCWSSCSVREILSPTSYGCFANTKQAPKNSVTTPAKAKLVPTRVDQTAVRCVLKVWLKKAAVRRRRFAQVVRRLLCLPRTLPIFASFPTKLFGRSRG